MKIKLTFLILFSICRLALSLEKDSNVNQHNEFSIHATINDVRRVAQQANLAALSLQPEKTCTLSKKSPPDKLLKRKYKEEEILHLHMQQFEIDKFIFKLDLNGDGICDWLRDGAEPHITDAGFVIAQDFIFMGTSAGWRHTDQTKKAKERIEQQMKLYKYIGDPKRLSRPSDFMGFYAPLATFAYEKGNPKPFVVAYSVMEDRQSPTISDYKTFRWNDEIDNLEQVPLPQHAAIMVFLQKEFCGKDPSKVIPNRDVSRFSERDVSRFSEPSYTDNTLCKKPDPSIKK